MYTPPPNNIGQQARDEVSNKLNGASLHDRKPMGMGLMDIKKGARAILEGFAFFATKPGVILYSIVPFIINMITLVAAFWLFIHYYHSIYEHILTTLGITIGAAQEGTFHHILHYILVGAVWTFKILLFIVGAIVLFFATYIVGMIVASPFNDMLSERVEELVTNVPAPAFSFVIMLKGALRSVQVESVKALIWIAAMAVGLLLNLIPVAGNIAYVVFVNVFCVWYLGWIYTDYPMSRRLYGFRARLAFGRKFAAAHLGLGIVFFIPFFQLIFNAPMVIAGTLLYLRLTNDTPREK